MKKLLVTFAIISLVLSGRLASADWPGDPTINVPICTNPDYQDYPAIVHDSSSGAIITWQDFRNGNYDIYAQHVDSEGTVLWQENGVPICTDLSNQSIPVIISDGSGGAIITWRDLRSGNPDIYAQRVNWETDGIPICTDINEQSSPAIVSDGSGGAIIVWEDYRSSSDFDIYAQRVNSDGQVQWDKDGVPICTAVNEQSSPKVVDNDLGRAIIVWEDRRSGNSDIYAQRVDDDGNILWRENGVSICNAVNGQKYPTLVSNGENGVIITWEDYREGLSNIYAQSVDSEGSVKWDENGVEICTAADSQYSPIIVFDGSGGAIIAWEDKRSGNGDIYAQRVNSDGDVQWEINGIPIYIAAGSQRYQVIRDGTLGILIIGYQMVSDDDGGAIITWHDENCDIYAQRVNFDGDFLWQENGIAISTAPNCQDYPKITCDDANGAIITWSDYRNGNYDIYAQRVYSDGSLGDATPPEKVTDFAVFTLTSKSATLTWTAPGDDEDVGTADIYDIRYSTSEITEDNWDSATQCDDLPLPQQGGSFERFTVTGLSSKTIYYFALKARDESLNWSELSNVVATKTVMKEGDVSGDDTISAYDAALILQFVVGLIDYFPFETLDSPIQGIPKDYTISIPNLTAKTGERVRVPIIVENANGLLGGGIALGYDPFVLKATRVTPSFLLSGCYWQHSIKDGQVRMAFAGAKPIKRDGEIFYVEFEIIGGYEGERISLIIETADFTDSLTITKNHGQIEILPQNTVLLPNYPNPFNSETWIPFKLSKYSDVHISIFSDRGELTRSFPLGLKDPGSYIKKNRAVYWDGRNEKGERVSSGVYFYTLKTSYFKSTRRMVILK